MEIVDERFAAEVQGSNGVRLRVSPKHKDKFRTAIVTIKVTKPRGRRFRLAAADLTLHYHHGQNREVAPCEGISTFNRTRDEDRPIELSRTMGPGWVKKCTGPRSTQASVVYFDAVFHNVEHNIREAWLCVGQPTTRAAFRSGGWTKS
jgi:hypothetical protein